MSIGGTASSSTIAGGNLGSGLSSGFGGVPSAVSSSLGGGYGTASQASIGGGFKAAGTVRGESSNVGAFL